LLGLVISIGCAAQGGFVPGQKRAPGDPAQIARGKTLYGINCRGCHGADLRGGDLGGPNLLRSQVALGDVNGEKIVPIIQGARKSQGMPSIPISIPDSNAVAAYVRSIVGQIQQQGMPPDTGKEPPSILVGNAAEGKAFFDAKCSGCHSTTGDLAGIGGKFKDLKKLQNAWVAGGTEHEFNGPEGNSGKRAVMATVTLPSGESVEGKVLQIDDFILTLQVADGSERSFRRDGDVPKVTVHDPLEPHREMLPQYTNKDVHDVTAYLATLK
jgi:cytochrome c oxidase cbb3-type subunit 3